MAVLRCIQPFAFDEANGTPRVLRVGDLVDSNDPAVKGRTQLFEAVEATVNRAVEQTTSGPGERRSLTRPRKKAASADEVKDEAPKADEAPTGE